MGRQLARKSTLSFINHIIMAIFSFISLVFVKRYMGYEAVGMIAFAVSLMTMFSIIGDMGFGVAHLKRVGEGLDIGRCNGTIITIKTLLTIVMGGVIFLYLFIQKHIFNYEFESNELKIVVYIIIINSLIQNIAMAFNNIFSARLEIAKGQIPRLVRRSIVMILKISFALVGFSVIYLAYAELIGVIVYLLLCILLFLGYPLKKPNKEFIKKYATFAIPVVFLGAVGKLAETVDKVMLGYFLGSYEVGIYSVPQRITQTLLLISTVITNILFVAFSSYYSKKNFSEIQRLSNNAEKYISTLVLPFVIILVVFAEPILLIFGDDTGPSVPILQIMAVAIYLMAIMNPYSVQVVSTGHIKIGFKLALLSLGLNLLLNSIFIPENIGGISLLGLGAKGAAIATMISFAIQGILARIVAYRITKTRPNNRILLHFIAAALTFTPIYLLYSTLHFEWIYLFGYFLLTFALFLLIMGLFREFTKKDFELYLNAVHPGKMKKYIVGELRNK